MNGRNPPGSGSNNKRLTVLVVLLAVLIAVALLTNFVIFTEDAVPEEMEEIEPDDFVEEKQIQRETLDTLTKLGRNVEWEENVELFRDPFLGPAELQETLELAVENPEEDTVEIIETPPLIEDGRTLIPMEEVMENVEEDMEFDPDTEEIVVQREAADLALYLDEQEAQINGETILLDAPPQMVDETIMIPLRFVYERLGLNVEYDKDAGIITITTG